MSVEKKKKETDNPLNFYIFFFEKRMGETFFNPKIYIIITKTYFLSLYSCQVSYIKGAMRYIRDSPRDSPGGSGSKEVTCSQTWLHLVSRRTPRTPWTPRLALVPLTNSLMPCHNADPLTWVSGEFGKGKFERMQRMYAYRRMLNCIS